MVQRRGRELFSPLCLQENNKTQLIISALLLTHCSRCPALSASECAMWKCGPRHADSSYIPLKAACDADKAGGVELPGDQSRHIVSTQTDANMVDPRNSAQRRGDRQGGEYVWFL